MTEEREAGGRWAIEATNLSRRYGRRWALASVSLRVPSGATLLLAGKNGSGKSTLLRALATAIRIDRGEVFIEGMDIRRDRDAIRRKTVLLDHHAYTYEALTAIQNLSVAASILGRPHGRSALIPILEEAGLRDRADDEVAGFSAGMRKRLSIARLLLRMGRAGGNARPSVVLLDEPYNQLDPEGFRLVDQLLERLKRDGATVVMATHLVDRGAPLCDLGLLLEQGQVVWSGSAPDLPRHAGISQERLF